MATPPNHATPIVIGQRVSRYARNHFGSPDTPHTNYHTPSLSVVVPLFNEQENLAELYRRLCESLHSPDDGLELVFVNDGSTDATRDLLDLLAATDPRVCAVHLSRNFGHQAAVCAGLQHASGSAVVVMDGDLQDPPEILPQFVATWRTGFDVVYAVRTKRKEGWLKRLGYFSFYRILNSVADQPMPLDSGDFCLMDRKVVQALLQLPERVRFVRGLRSFVGFRQTGLVYERDARAAGTPKYTLRKLVALAIDGLMNFSSFPLRAVVYCGLALALLSVGLVVGGAVWAFMNQRIPAGWFIATTVVSLVGSLQLFGMGIVGEYIRRIFLEVKARPTYIVERVHHQPATDAPRQPCEPRVA